MCHSHVLSASSRTRWCYYIYKTLVRNPNQTILYCRTIPVIVIITTISPLSSLTHTNNFERAYLVCELREFSDLCLIAALILFWPHKLLSSTCETFYKKFVAQNMWPGNVISKENRAITRSTILIRRIENLNRQRRLRYLLSAVWKPSRGNASCRKANLFNIYI